MEFGGNLSKRKTLIVGAWKAYLRQADANNLADKLTEWRLNDSKYADYEIVLSPSMTYLIPVKAAISKTDIKLSAQDVDPVTMGAYTGHIPPQILKDVGCEYVILGHSELRRQKEYSLQLIHDKVNAALEAKLKVILCIGEELAERNLGKTNVVLKEQIETALENIDESLIKDNFNIAYEPVWAISSQNPIEPPKPEEVNSVHNFIRQTLNAILSKTTTDTVRILYGGSVNSENVCGYLHEPLVDGVLVGSESTRHPNFIELLTAVEKNVLLIA